MINPKLRRTLARITLPIFLLWSLWIPRQAYAFVAPYPGAYGIGTQAGLVSGAGGMNLFGVGLAAFAVGMALGYIIVDAATGGIQRMPMTNNPQLQVPPPTVPDLDPEPSVTVFRPNMYPLTVGWLDTYCGAIAAGFQAWMDTGPWGVPNFRSGSITACNEQLRTATATVTATTHNGQYYPQQIYNYTGNDTFTQVVPEYCPTDYVLINHKCVIGDPRSKPDGACDYSRTGDTISIINDPDCAGQGVICTASGCTVLTTDASNNDHLLKITPTADGGSQLDIYDERVINNTPVIDRTTVTIGGDGTVGGVSGGTQTGTVPTDGTSPTTGNDVVPTDIQFPSDYARTGEAATAATQIIQAVSPKLDLLHTDNVQTQTKLDTLHDDLTKTETTTDPEAPLPDAMPWVGTTFSSLTSWSVPVHVSACPTYQLDLSSVLGVGKVFTFDAHCGLLADQQNNMRLASLTAWLILSLFVVLRA